MPGKYDIEGYGTYEIDSDDDAEIQSTIAEIIAHEKAARASRPTLGGPTGLASKRLAALGGKPESEKGDFAPQPTPIAGNAIPAIEPVIAHAIGAAGQNPISSTLPGDLAGDGVRKYVPEEWYQAPKKDIRPEARRRYAALTDQVAPLEEGPETPKFIERHSRAMTAAIPETSAAPSAGGRFLRALDEHIAEMNPTNPAKPSDMLKAPGQLAEALNDYTDNAALLPISKLAGYLPDDPTWIPGAPAIQALANTRFGRGAVRGSGVNVGEGPISYKQGIEAALKVPEGFSRAGDVATLGAMGLPVVGPAILAGMIPEQIGHAGSDLGEIAGGLIGGDPEGAGMRAPGAAVNAGMLGLMGAHGLKSLEQGRMAEAAAKEQAAMAATERAAAPWYSQDFRAPEDVMAAARGDAHPLQQIRRGEYAPPPQPPPFVSGPEGQAQGPFPVPPDVQAQAGAPPADLRARTGNAPRPAPPPVDPATLLGRILENPQAPETPMRPTNPAVGDVPSWQDRQRAERASPAKPPAEENIQVEPKATTDAQLAMVKEGQGQPGKKPGVLYTVQGGAKPPDVVPDGLARVDGPAGTLIFDPSKVTPEQAREALTSGEGLDKALGFSGPRPEPHPDNAVVSVLGKDGVEKSSQVAGPTTFRTEQGVVPEGQTRGTSSYTVDAQGRTTRAKGQHFGHDTKDVGVKTPSDRTVYVDENASTRLGALAALPKGTKATVIEKDGRLYPATWNDAAGKWGLAPADRAGYPIVSDTPKVGLHPVELWGPREGPQGREYRSSHAGNRIVEVTPGDVEGAVKAAQGMAGEGDQVAVRTPDEVIADRQAGIEAEKKPPLDLKGIPAKVREHADGNVAAAGDSRVVTLRGDRGDAFVVHESANEPGAWQLTHLDKDGSPSGHRLFKSREDAIRSASGQVVRGDPSSVGSGYKVERRVEDKGPEGRLHFVDVGQIAQDKLNEALDLADEARRISEREAIDDAVSRARAAEILAPEHAEFAAAGREAGGLPRGGEAARGPAAEGEGLPAPVADAGAAPEAPRAPTPEPGVRPAAEPVAPGARKALLDERAASIEERRELQRKIREDSLSPKKLARAKEELRETELHLKALDKKLGYEAGGPTATQVEADLKERFGDRYEPEAPKLVEAAPGEAPSAEPQAATDTPPRGPRFVGNKGKAALQPNEHVRFRYELRDASDVITSHDDMLVEDPRFDRGDNLQPRDRERDASREQIEKIEKAPDPLIMGASPTVQIGAPWLEPAGDRVAVGNGRTIAHRRAYRKGSPAAERYRQMLRDDAENYGFTKEDVDALPHPMLVRVPLDPMTPEQLGRFADYGNRTDELRMSPAERSQADARRISPATMAKFEPGDNGDLNVASNDAFRARWVSEVLTQAERAEYLSADGRTLLPGGIQRMQESVVAKGYGSPTLVEKLLEGGGGADGLTKTAITGLMRASSTVGKTRMMVEGGEAHKIDFTAPITEALTKYAELRKAGTSIGDFLDQGDMFGDPMSPEARQVLSVLEANKRSAKGLGNYISAVARALENAGDPRTELVGAKPTISDIYGAARIEYEERHGAQGGLFGRAEPVSPSVPSAGGEGGDGGFDFGPDEGGPGGGAPGGTGPDGGGGGAPGGGRPGGGEPGGKPRVFAYSSGKGVGRDPYAERTGRQAVPVPTFKRRPRTPPVRPPEGPLEVWKVETLAPNYAKLQDGRAEFLKDIHEFFSATTMDDPAKVVSNIKIATKAERAFRVARLDMALRGMERAFDRFKSKDRMKTMEEFAMAGEERRKQATPELQAHWDFYHAMTEAAYADMQRYGHDKFAGYIKDQDYFARQFVNEGEATAFAHEWYDRKSVDGPKGFLKKRYYELLSDALASGLKLKHDNPARALMEYQAGVQQFLGWQKESSRSIRAGIRKYIPIDREVPHGWDQIHPERGLVYGDPAVMLGEALTKRHLLMEEIAKDLGIKVDRLPGVGGEFGRAEIGGAAGARDVAVRAGTPVGILAHEIGHILDSDYKLWDEMMSNKDASPAVRTELRDLAALRYESKAGTVSQGYKDYVHTKEEQIANMLDAYVAEPNLLREVAPVALGEFRSFLLKTPALHKFFEMEPGGKAAGLELEERVHRIPIKGKVVVGRWISPTSVVRLIDRDLTKGFQDKLAYRSLRNLTNVMNRIQLGFSGFHGVFTGLDSVTGNLTLALQEAVAATQPQHAGKGFGVDAAKRIASMAIFPVIPFRRYAEGHRLQKIAEGLPHDMPFEQMPQEIRQFIVAGGRFWEDPSHAANQVRAFQKALDRSNPIGGAFHLPGAVIETVSSLIMEKWVPRLKIGMFAQEAAFEMKRLGPDATDTEIAYHLRRVQESVENRFGQLAYENLLWHRAVKDIGQVTVRSLGWGLGSIRDIGGGIFDAGRMSHRAERNRLVESKKTMQRVVIKNAERDFNAAQQAAQTTPTKANIEKAEKAWKALEQTQAAMPSNLNDPVFTRRMAYPIALGISVGMMGALYHLAKRGKLPANAKDFYAIPTGGRNKDGSEERVFLPTYAKEIYAWATHPWETALHKLSPALATGAEIAKNQDYFGTKVREGNPAEQTKDSVEHWIRSLVPFSMRQLMQSQFPGSELGKTEAGLGITKAPASLSRSAAEEKLNEYLHRTSGGIKTKAEAEKSKARSEIKALIRGGHDEAADAAIEKAIEEHQVSPDEKQGRRALYKAAAKTVLENTLRSMPVDEALEVYRAATPEERQRWADAFRARVFGSASRRPSWWKDRPQEEVEAIQAEAEKLLPPE